MTTTKPRSKYLVPGALGACLLVGGVAGEIEAQQQPAPQALGVEVANFDPSVRPQDDFYQYVNGTWLRDTEIPADRSRYGAFTELRDESQKALREIIEEAAAAQNAQPDSERQMVGDFYESYMDEARIEALGLKPLQQELNHIARLRDKAALPEQFAYLQRIGVQTPFAFYVYQDAKNATEYISYLSQSGLGLPDRSYYFKEGEKFEETRAAYTDYIETLLRRAGEPNPAGAAQAIVALETSLAEGHWERAKNRDRNATYNRYEIAELDSLAPNFAWDRFFAAVDAEETPAVIVRQPDYLQTLNRVLGETSLPVLQKYLTFKLLDSYAAELSSEFADARFAFRGQTLQGLEEQRPRWKQGVDAVDDALGMAVGKMYVERHFQPEAKARMEELVANLREAFRLGIDNLEWMSPETKAQAQEKLAKFNVKIGYPDEWKDYSGLEVREGDLVGNVMRSNRFEFQRMVDKLGEPIDRSEWGMTPQTVNAYYSPSMNEIVFPAAILQPPFFNVAADDAVNYGAIGAVIGHEISHGFDDQGRKSDGEGNLRDWWTEADAAAFEERAGMLIEQYNAFNPVGDLRVNGELTLGENIGDLSGLAVAHEAYKLSLDGKEAPVIGGFTGDQRFFLGWGQIWRNRYRDEALRQQLLTDPHSPGRYRVNGVLVNLPAFYEAFGVEKGDEMYLPEAERVEIW